MFKNSLLFQCATITYTCTKALTVELQFRLLTRQVSLLGHYVGSHVCRTVRLSVSQLVFRSCVGLHVTGTRVFRRFAWQISDFPIRWHTADAEFPSNSRTAGTVVWLVAITADNRWAFVSSLHQMFDFWHFSN